MVSVKNPAVASGVESMKGAIGWAVGPKADTTTTNLKETMLYIPAVPKDKVAEYEDKRWDKNSMKAFAAGQYVVYTVTSKPTDSGVQRVIGSLKYQP